MEFCTNMQPDQNLRNNFAARKKVFKNMQPKSKFAQKCSQNRKCTNMQNLKKKYIVAISGSGHRGTVPEGQVAGILYHHATVPIAGAGCRPNNTVRIQAHVMALGHIIIRS